MNEYQTQEGLRLEDTGNVDWDKQVREILDEVRMERAEETTRQMLVYHKVMSNLILKV